MKPTSSHCFDDSHKTSKRLLESLDEKFYGKYFPQSMQSYKFSKRSCPIKIALNILPLFFALGCGFYCESHDWHASNFPLGGATIVDGFLMTTSGVSVTIRHRTGVFSTFFHRGFLLTWRFSSGAWLFTLFRGEHAFTFPSCRLASWIYSCCKQNAYIYVYC